MMRPLPHPGTTSGAQAAETVPIRDVVLHVKVGGVHIDADVFLLNQKTVGAPPDSNLRMTPMSSSTAEDGAGGQSRYGSDATALTGAEFSNMAMAPSTAITRNVAVTTLSGTNRPISQKPSAAVRDTPSGGNKAGGSSSSSSKGAGRGLAAFRAIVTLAVDDFGIVSPASCWQDTKPQPDDKPDAATLPSSSRAARAIAKSCTAIVGSRHTCTVMRHVLLPDIDTSIWTLNDRRSGRSVAFGLRFDAKPGEQWHLQAFLPDLRVVFHERLLLQLKSFGKLKMFKFVDRWGCVCKQKPFEPGHSSIRVSSGLKSFRLSNGRIFPGSASLEVANQNWMGGLSPTVVNKFTTAEYHQSLADRVRRLQARYEKAAGLQSLAPFDLRADWTIHLHLGAFHFLQVGSYQRGHVLVDEIRSWPQVLHVGRGLTKAPGRTPTTEEGQLSEAEIKSGRVQVLPMVSGDGVVQRHFLMQSNNFVEAALPSHPLLPPVAAPVTIPATLAVPPPKALPTPILEVPKPQSVGAKSPSSPNRAGKVARDLKVQPHAFPSLGWKPSDARGGGGDEQTYEMLQTIVLCDVFEAGWLNRAAAAWHKGVRSTEARAMPDAASSEGLDSVVSDDDHDTIKL
eukprot:NODE_499_length_2985_cov_3.793562.p1 GENE.NODE_499_length_2985_cov_3.793562~~NODE_499_length_2985_cov_3.793562.p1  ORF type:complete len:706 (+),score=126.50 NODE_499_length_2985_cov_3.793562:254-2119(+)